MPFKPFLTLLRAVLSWAVPKSHPDHLSAGRKESWPQSLRLGNSPGLISGASGGENVDLETPRSPQDHRERPPSSSQPRMMNRWEGIGKKREGLSLLDILLTCQRLVLGARLPSLIFGSQYWVLL